MQKIKTILSPHLLVDLFRKRYITSVKSLSIKTMVFTYYVYADNPFNKIIKFQKNKSTHRTPFHA